MCDVWVGEGFEDGSDDCDVEYCPTDLTCLSGVTISYALDENTGGDGACCPMGLVHLIGEPRDLVDHARSA